MGLRLIINGHGSMEPIYSNTPLASLADAENEADVYIGTECDITVFDQGKDETIKVLQHSKDFLNYNTEGMDAYLNGLPIDKNPNSEGSKKYEDWKAGWEEALSIHEGTDWAYHNDPQREFD